MKSLSYLLAIVVAGTLGITTVAQARGYSHGGGNDRSTPQHRFEKQFDRRQARQWGRIEEGIEKGDLSHREARQLARSQRHIARMEDRFERDGYYSPHERRKLERALNRNSRQIEHAKRNAFARPHGHHHRGWRGRHHGEPYAYEEADESYAYGRSSSTTISAQADGFSVSWSTANQE